MAECLVTGMSNVGKTCFVINFAEYMGLKELKIHVKQIEGYTSINSYTPGEARNKLISVKANSTREVQAIKLEIPRGKTFKELKIIDSCGLSDGIHPEEEVRLAMARTIRLIRESSYILHMIDITNINSDQNYDEVLKPIDRLILDYASLKQNYAVLLNKIDLSYARKNLKLLMQSFENLPIIPISALYQQGFKEVKKLVLNYV